MNKVLKKTFLIIGGIFAFLCVCFFASCFTYNEEAANFFSNAGFIILVAGIVALLFFISNLRQNIKHYEKENNSSYVIRLKKNASPLALTLYGDSPYSKYGDFVDDFSMTEDQFIKFCVCAIDEAINKKREEHYNSAEHRERIRNEREEELAFYRHMKELDSADSVICDEDSVIMEAWDGTPVMVPVSRIEEYQKAQDEIKKRNGEMTPGEKKLAEIIAKAMKERYSKRESDDAEDNELPF